MRYSNFRHSPKHARHARPKSKRDAVWSLPFNKRFAQMFVAALVLVVLAVPVTAVPVMLNAEEVSQNTDALQEQASGNAGSAAVADISGSAEKKEVVYVTLENTGATESIYVVNVFDGSADVAGKTIQDFGEYEQVVNLTDTSKLTQFSDSVVLTIPEGEFSYQGTTSNAQIPWNISMKYSLDGQEVSPDELAGKSGSFELNITTSQNSSVDSRYFENYLLQITCTLPLDVAKNVKTEQGSIALSGSDVTVSFMVMPDKDGDVSLSADVSNFEMAGISFAAIPFSMALDFPDTESLVSQFDALIDGTDELHSGAQELASGVDSIDAATKEAASGAVELATGATQMTQGLKQYQQALRDQADELVAAASSMDPETAEQYYKQLLQSYAEALFNEYTSLKAEDVNEEKTDEELWRIALANVSESSEGQQVEAALEAVATQIASQSAAQALDGAADGLGSVDSASSLLGGSAALGSGAQELASGLDKLAGGTGELAIGASTLADGTQSLAQETQGIPDAVQAEIDELMSTYDKSDFEPASFTSSKNTNVTLVQFVMTTDPIKVEEPATEEEPVEEETLLDRFLALF